MKNNHKPRIAFVEPPLEAHRIRGTGIYGKELYHRLLDSDGFEMHKVNFSENLKGFDLVHYPYFDPFFRTLKIFPGVKTVVTVHDLIPLEFPDRFPRGIRGELKWQIQKYLLKQADAIITDSHASRISIMKNTGIAKDKISVIYLGVGGEFKKITAKEPLEMIKRKYRLPEKFILNVGDVNYNKNVPVLIQAFSLVSRKAPSVKLVLAGKGFEVKSRELSEINHLITSMDMEDKIILLGNIPLNALVGLYNGALFYVAPSLAEGFGLPILEAFACGCPVAAAEGSSLSELTGDAAELFDPRSVSGIARSMYKIINRKELRKKLSDAGFARVKQFKWDKCAKETEHVYERLLS